MRRKQIIILITLAILLPIANATNWKIMYMINDATFMHPGQPLILGGSLYQAGVYEVNYVKYSFYIIALNTSTGSLEFAKELIFNLNETRIWGRGIGAGQFGILRKSSNGDIIAVFLAKRIKSSFSATIVAKLKESGEVEWAKYYLLPTTSKDKVTPRELMPVDVLVASDGIYLLGKSVDNPKSVTVLIKISNDGDVIWARSYMNLDTGTIPTGIDLTSNGDIIMLVNTRKPLLLWLDKDGNITKVVGFDFGMPAKAEKVYVAENRIYVIGHLRPELFEPFIVVLDEDGNLIWAKRYPNSGYDFVSIASDVEYLYILGKSGSTLQEGKEGYERRVWVLSLDKEGNPRWNRVTGDSIVMNELGGMAVDEYIYVTYYRNALRGAGVVFMAIGKDGHVPCPSNSPTLIAEQLDVKIKDVKPPSVSDIKVEVYQLDARSRELDISEAIPCENVKTTTTKQSTLSPTKSPTETKSKTTTSNEEIIKILTKTQTSKEYTKTTSQKSPSNTQSPKREGTCGPGIFILIPLVLLSKRKR
ncbi:CGP-CTERM sorting domain-containing protein [Pyrococcus abyssi]|uniref:CGP-CTERM sorting domain-containing protein n=1 Tax=Pyrococcus abyssi (strain GE5 / Orsay) TaxID=272844 RepID=Q9UZW3_PYRAB|nr:CGP-CTERM sorting domain-containing protein [Pyrococcus abyssi]CAB49943.1 Hypothetical protein PAB0690 [Pyrococcus abyssi GE5]CCE70442.1 TPA: hypothetical protein PAB0690 [Pyrococcus abyssi GE5]